ncbi:DUF3899 domain-containing protein [Salimicrobium halophilum]|uniref:DUF3899 domain-containing protein n=1 Tax=Salimicrobium halophilum TaxID=86666 RepID=A0A1G8TT58_9BACI|nr:DUF3899 domain-containing protein [Salimicrobium halophilum]SDJ44643.1 protein of unknown function [Salimicrobium halophilum]
MEVIKRPPVVVLLNFLIASVMFLMNAPEYTLFYYINSVFYIVFFYLFVALLMWVIRGKFFDGVTYSFRRFYSKVSKQRDYLEEWKEKPLPSDTINHSWLRMFFFHGSLMLIAMLLLLAIYYV